MDSSPKRTTVATTQAFKRVVQLMRTWQFDFSIAIAGANLPVITQKGVVSNMLVIRFSEEQ